MIAAVPGRVVSFMLVVFGLSMNSGCLTDKHTRAMFADYGIPLHVIGFVTDSRTSVPIHDAEVTLISVSMNRENGELIGLSDAGSIIIDYDVEFGRLEVELESGEYTEPDGDFTIRISHPKYADYSQAFNYHRLTRGKRWVVDLGGVKLTPDSQQSADE
jgi:hypothetical protein